MGKIERIIVGVLGGLLILLAGIILVFGVTPPFVTYLSSLFVFVLGANALRSAWVNKKPWISKIGPLP